MKVICRLTYWDRYCDVSGVFIEEKELIDYVLEREFEINGGELAGKHSSVDVPVNKDTLSILSDNQEAVRVLEEIGLKDGFGFNPFDYEYYDYENTETGFYDEDVDEPTYYESFKEYIEKKVEEGKINNKQDK